MLAYVVHDGWRWGCLPQVCPWPVNPKRTPDVPLREQWEQDVAPPTACEKQIPISEFPPLYMRVADQKEPREKRRRESEEGRC